MLRYALRRVPSALAVLAIASVVVFGVLHLATGDPAVLAAGPDASARTVSAVRHQLGLDAPLPQQYLTWLGGVLTGDLGDSYVRGVPVATLIGNGLGNPLELTLGAVVLAVLLGGLAGLVLGVARGRLLRGATAAATALAFAIPPYVSGVLLVMVFAITHRILPAGGHVSVLADPEIGVQYLIMPALALALPAAAVLARFLSTSIRRVFGEDYIRIGTAKGLRRRRIVLCHALPNALPPVLTVLGIQIGQMLGGAIVVEAIFAWPGVGQLIIDSLKSSDYFVVQNLLLITVTVFVVLQTVTDLLHAAVDPRLRME
ncbi:peptide ABC transporter permease [Streptomyces antioxidans]|uniref:Peptide ABC transporter permease n=1 Tax=Streptomyces antioxidans TaxID=1507734 RepID=A0A1V4D7M4_9ACTN|nr:ABC transporter permease [Streptomyces antioxidans]OPF81046.1 peptide ABC transporter permease [Streptomyces antioxidans]